ncbi:hypothetical protein EPIR_1005 [Erwinia piriflorinigrans CFBP 5888]|uniref:Uncharacterized protein n=1 Tax=Erwinia piriflorinigrans CFBP 5888 TaxID=1161919 RepID=V5Z5U0_9GAMM|nr:hypothetical protein EPIR_1005 [Erwinia piriflorinigrans CFBP 5888]
MKLKLIIIFMGGSSNAEHCRLISLSDCQHGHDHMPGSSSLL